MKRRIRWSAILLTLLLAAIIAGPGHGRAAEPRQLTIGSGNTTGVYYAASAALAKIVDRNSAETGLYLLNQASQGSAQNIDDVVEGKVAFGLAQADMLFKAMTGGGPWDGHPLIELRGVFALHSEALTLVAAVDAEISGIADLQGKRVNIGAPGSGDNENARRVLELAGVRPEAVQLSEAQAAIASDLLQDGEIDAYFYTVGHPNLSVREASSGNRKVRLIPLPEEMIQQFAAARPYLHAVSIPVDDYPGLEDRRPVPTVGEKAVLFTRADMDEATVQVVVRTVLDNLDLFRRQHPALEDLTAQGMAAVPVLPLHPGAQEAFRRAGVLR